MLQLNGRYRWAALALTGLLLIFGRADAQQGERGQSSYMPVDITESFASLKASVRCQARCRAAAQRLARRAL